jgi:phage gp36-like protein
MAPYCTPADVRQVLSPDGQQNDDYDTAASFSDAALTDAVARATGTVNSYLSTRFAVPVLPQYDTDNSLRDWTSTVAAYYATLTYSRGDDIAPDDPIRLRYTAIMSILDDIRDGKLTPPWPAAPDDPGGAGEVTVLNRYDGHMFDLRDFDIGRGNRPYGWGTVPGWGGDW